MSLRRQLLELGRMELWLWPRTMRSLARVLEPDERIEQVAYGGFDEHWGLICATDRRLLCLRHNVLFGTQFRQLAYGQVRRFACQTGKVFGQLEVSHAEGQWRLAAITNAEARGLAEAIRQRRDEPR